MYQAKNVSNKISQAGSTPERNRKTYPKMKDPNVKQVYKQYIALMKSKNHYYMFWLLSVATFREYPY
jgi:hypothetical protein